MGQAIAVWRSAPGAEPRIGRTSAEIDQELATLPRLAGNDLFPDPSIVEAEQAWRVARAALSAHEVERPEGILNTASKRVASSRSGDIGRHGHWYRFSKDLRGDNSGVRNSSHISPPRGQEDMAF